MILTSKQKAYLQEKFYHWAARGWLGKHAQEILADYAPEVPAVSDFGYRDINKAAKEFGCKPEDLTDPQ